MSSKREPIKKRTTKKRCPKGSHRDKTTGICVKYATIKTFENLTEQTISHTKNTLSLESLGKDGTIMKVYEKGELQYQVFVNDEKLQKAKKKAQKDIQKMLKMMHKIQKDPSKIEKDTKFKRMLKKIKGGGTGSPTTIQSNTDILIEEQVMEKIETKAVVKLEEKIENIEAKSQVENIWKSIGSHWEVISTILHVADVAGLAYMTGHFSSSFLPFLLDLVNAMAIVVMNILYTYYPEEENKQYTLYAQYLIYSFILGSSLFVTGAGILPNYIVVSIMGTMGLINSVIEHHKLNKTTEKMEEIKRKLVDVLENPTK